MEKTERRYELTKEKAQVAQNVIASSLGAVASGAASLVNALASLATTGLSKLALLTARWALWLARKAWELATENDREVERRMKESSGKGP